MEQLRVFLSGHPFSEIALLVAIVIVVSYIMKVLKQPMIIGYIIAGIITGPAVFGFMTNTETVKIFSHIGVALLLFMVGLGLNPAIVKDLGKASLVVGLGQVLFTTIFGFILAKVLGFNGVTSIYIALSLAFSSTIIIVKLLSDKGVLDELYGKISIGVLIVQDIIAMVILMVLSSLPTAGLDVNWGMFLMAIVGKMIAVGGVTYLVTRFILPGMIAKIATSQEFLLIFAIGWCLIFSASMEMIGFSLEIGALLAGISLASLPYRFEIGSRMKPLRDFFIMLFFVLLGAQLQFGDISQYIVSIILFSLFVLIGNPLIVMTLMGIMGFKKKNSMMVGFTVAQISEFSFILMALALSIGHITDMNIVSLVTLVGLVTITGSSYYFTYADYIYKKLYTIFSWFERKRSEAESQFSSSIEQYDVVVFGNHRTGNGIVEMLLKKEKKFVIVDYDPMVIKTLQKQGLPCLYGDAGDIETLENLDLQHVKMIVSTIHNYEANSLILQQIKDEHMHIVVIMSANTLDDAELLYKQGANYVLVPHVISGRHTALLIEEYEYDIEKYTQYKWDTMTNKL